MPIYEFACSDCGHGFERLQKLSDADPVECPACHRPTVKRQLSAPSFRLSGSGWYETDFKSDQDRKRNLAGAQEPAKDSGGDKGAADAKTPASAPTAPAATSGAAAGGTGSGTGATTAPTAST